MLARAREPLLVTYAGSKPDGGDQRDYDGRKKVALHFEQAKHGHNASQLVLSLARAAKLPIRSRVYAGTLLIHTGAAVQRRTDNAVVETTDSKAYAALIGEWLTPQPFNWFALHPRASEIVRADKIFCVQFDTIEPAIALRLHDELGQGVGAAYLGALQVDESFRSHLAGYQLPAFARVDDERAFASWDGISEDSKMPFVVEMLRRCGFDPVAYESLAAKFTVFDRYAGATAIQRRARCRASIIGLFDSVVDATLGRLEDALPELHERVWTILSTYEGAEVAEQYSQVALGCRRLIEYAADCLFPPAACWPRGLGKGATSASGTWSLANWFIASRLRTPLRRIYARWIVAMDRRWRLSFPSRWLLGGWPMLQRG